MKIVLVDIDKTLSDNSRRESQARREDGTLDWEVFTRPDLIVADQVLLSPHDLEISIWSGLMKVGRPMLTEHTIIYLAGREGTPEIQAATYQWLWEQGYDPAPVEFRRVGDRRPDHETKRDIIAQIMSGHGIEIILALDDCGRDYGDPEAMVRMYEAMGIHVVFPPERTEA